MKKSLLIIFTLSLFVLTNRNDYQNTRANNNLNDITNHQYKTAIDYLVEKKIASGYPDGSYQPNRKINRAELVKIIVGSLINEEPPTIQKACFPDVNPSEWFASYVCYAKENNIISGYPDGSFGPGNEINLVELSKIVVNALGIKTDEKLQAKEWYGLYIDALQKKRSLPDSFRSLTQAVNRAQMAEIIWRIKENISDQSAKTFNIETLDAPKPTNTETTITDLVPAAGNPNGNCSIPTEASLVNTTSPTTIIGNGSPESCTSQAVVDAVAKGGIITFNCGPEHVSIPMDQTARIFNDSTPEIIIDGAGKISLDGQGKRRILYMNTCDQSLKWTTPHCDNQDHPRLTVQNMTFINGNSTDLKKPEGGGAIFSRGGRLKILNSRFFNNICDPTGPDVGGAAIRAFDQYNDQPLYIVNSTFGGAEEYGNSCSNGGGLSAIGVSYTIINSLFSYNNAIGKGANPAKANTPGGGNGGAIYNDGNKFDLNICGTSIHDNIANEGGGGIFFVSNNRTGRLSIKNSSLKNNPSLEFETKGYPGIFYLGSGDIQSENSSFE
jgi:hypothetical protein